MTAQLRIMERFIGNARPLLKHTSQGVVGRRREERAAAKEAAADGMAAV
jgi:hypothetical protein